MATAETVQEAAMAEPKKRVRRTATKAFPLRGYPGFFEEVGALVDVHLYLDEGVEFCPGNMNSAVLELAQLGLKMVQETLENEDGSDAWEEAKTMKLGVQFFLDNPETKAARYTGWGDNSTWEVADVEDLGWHHYTREGFLKNLSKMKASAAKHRLKLDQNYVTGEEFFSKNPEAEAAEWKTKGGQVIWRPAKEKREGLLVDRRDVFERYERAQEQLDKFARFLELVNQDQD